MNSDAQLDQFGALAWLKWRLFRNAMRSRGAALDSAASILGTLAALVLSLLVAVFVGFGAYALAGEAAPAHRAAMRGDAAQSLILLFGMLTVLYMTWALVPITAGGGTQFDPGRLLLYPVSLRKLFVIDLLTEFTSLASIFAAPAILAIGIGAGAAGGSVALGLAAALVAVAFGLALSKLFSTTISVLMRTRRRRGEGVLAIAGLVLGFSGLLIQYGIRAAEGMKSVPAALRWTPPGAFATALIEGVRGEGDATYALAILTLAFYAAACAALTYRVAVGALNSSGGAGRSRAALAADAGATRGRARVALGWRLPFVSNEVSVVFEKELRYALRNAQLRTVLLMPVVMTFVLRFGMGPRRGFSSLPLSAGPYFEGARATFSLFYVLVAMTTLAANSFGYEGAGMRAYVLAPVSRRAILLGKNMVMLVLSLASALLVTVLNEAVFRDLSPRGLLFASLSFVFFAAVFASGGNSISVRYPKRLRYGKRAGASGMGGLLMLPLFLFALVAPVVAVVGGWAAGSVLVEYVILAALASLSVAAYLMLLGSQARELERRELDILEAVAKRDDE